MQRRRIANGLGSLWLVGSLLGSGACTMDQFVDQAGIPGGKTGTNIVMNGKRDRYIDATVETAGKRYRFFFPQNESCLAVLREGAQVSYQQRGVLGTVTSGDAVCEPVGLMSLREWRNRGPRARSNATVPRAQANYREIYRDADMIMLRGDFPLAGMLRWGGGIDTIAVVGNEDICQGVVAKGVASMEFRQGGNRVLDLVAKNGLCSIIGLVRPPGQAEVAAEEAAASEATE